MIDWPENLVRDLARRQVAVVIGAGVSKNSLSQDGNVRPPLWSELLDAGVQRIGNNGTRHIKSAIKSNDLLHACEWLKECLDEGWIDFLREHLTQPAFQPADIHKSLLALDQRIYLTPNFDNIFENFVQTETGGRAIVKRFCDPDAHTFLREDNLNIIKLHGSIQNPNELIFTQREYAQARIQHASFYEALDACLLSHTFLFVGCGVSDPDISLLLENQRFKFPYSLPHYFVTSQKINKSLQRSLRNNKNLKCIPYDPANHHAQLSEGLEDLADRVDVARQAI